MPQIKLRDSLNDKNLSFSASIYVLLVSIFLSVLLITHIITAKYIKLGAITLTAGAITYPFTFTVVDIIAEIYGSKRAKFAVWMGLFASLLMNLLIQIIRLIPIYDRSPVSQHAFECVFGFTPGILFASMAAYLVAQLIDIYLFGYIAKLTHNKHLWLRNIASTSISQLLDTILFGWIAWILWPLLSANQAIVPLAWDTWHQLTTNEYLVKIIFILFNIPLVYLSVHVIRCSAKTKL